MSNGEINLKINEELTLTESINGLTFGTDAYLLSAFTEGGAKKRCADLGSGTGVIPLLCVQKNKYIVFSPDLKVLEVSDENKWADTVVTVELPDVRRAIEGEIIEFSGVEKTEYISGFIKSLGNFKGDTKIDKIYLSDYFNIKMLCENRYMISFGKYDAIDVKMHTLEKVIESKTVSESAAATIDISDPKEPRVIPYDRADAIS